MELTPITEISELRQLRDLYSQNWPKHCVGFYCLDNFLRWLLQKPTLKHLHIYTLNGDWRSEGLFVIVDRYQLFLSSLNVENNELLFKAISLLDWSAGYKVSSFLECHRSSVLDVVREKHLSMEYDSKTLLYYMPCIQALKLEINCPAGFIVRALSLEDAEIINDLWPNKHFGSYVLIQRLISMNPNVGVYKQDTAELVAWCLRLQGGFLGALQVKEDYKRLGLGSVVTRALSKNLAEMGHDTMALVNEENKPSRNMFDKLGFKTTNTCYWLRTYPIDDNLQWPEGE